MANKTMKTLTMNGITYEIVDEYARANLEEILSNLNKHNIRVANVNLLAANWTGNKNPYSQVVEIEGITPYSQVDLTPNVEQLVVFYEKDLTFVTENEDGVVTVFAIGQKPTNDYTVQVTITEVSV